MAFSTWEGSTRVFQSSAGDDGLDLDMLAEAAPQHVGHLPDQPAEIERHGAQRLAPREGQQMARQAGAPIGTQQRVADSPQRRLVALHLAGEDVQIADDDLQQIVEVMGHPAGELADRLHLLRLLQHAFGAQSLGDVEERGDEAAPRHFVLLNLEVAPGDLEAAQHPVGCTATGAAIGPFRSRLGEDRLCAPRVGRAKDRDGLPGLGQLHRQAEIFEEQRVPGGEPTAGVEHRHPAADVVEGGLKMDRLLAERSLRLAQAPQPAEDDDRRDQNGYDDQIRPADGDEEDPALPLARALQPAGGDRRLLVDQ